MRNWLFKSYAGILKDIEPAGFIFENVRGILNLEKGRFFEMIKHELQECVETIKVNQVNAAHFGIPQRRNRVIIVGGDQKMVDDFKLKEITAVAHERMKSALPLVAGARDVLDDLPPLHPGEDGSTYNYRTDPTTSYQELMRGTITPEEYLATLR